MALVLLIAALALRARPRASSSVTAALQPAPGAAVAAGPSFEGWAEPPAYTGRPTLYLPEVSGERAGAGAAGHAGDPARLRRARALRPRRDGVGRRGAAGRGGAGDRGGGVPGRGQRLGGAAPGRRRRSAPGPSRWSRTPARRSRSTGAIERAPTGETRFAYTARDDYGIAGARAEITLDLGEVDRAYGLAAEPEPRPALVAELPLPMSGAGEEVAETLVEDFSKHPFAGLPVTVRLTAEDAIGQTGDERAGDRRCCRCGGSTIRWRRR